MRTTNDMNLGLDYEKFGPTLDSDGQVVARPRTAYADDDCPNPLPQREEMIEVLACGLLAACGSQIERATRSTAKLLRRTGSLAHSPWIRPDFASL